MASMANVLGVIFSDMHENYVPELTERRTTASVPFGARYRLIDFPLSNMSNSGVAEVGVVAKNNYQSLLDHLGAGGEWDLSRKVGGLRILPPFGQTDAGLYRGRLDALAGIRPFIERTKSEYVILADADLIANVDFKPIVESHVDSKADITLLYGGAGTGDKAVKTFVKAKDGKIVDVLVRPHKDADTTAYGVSLNVFVLSKKLLLDIITDTSARNLYSFDIDVIQHRLSEFDIRGYKFEGYYAQIDSMDAYFKANKELFNSKVRGELFHSDNPIYTKVRDDAPAKYEIGSNVKNALIADGCVIEGTVENSVLFRGVKIGKGAVVKNAIVMQDTVVGDNCEITAAILDKDVTVAGFRTLAGTEDYPVYVAKGAKV
ncbi:glucose-1-phosphate adenylyltransferase subunit GlgD [Clostridia bacterium]|nr:glucose-1-phosphate adenylyltransferase subunit GlgD [Clostridia bacterium]